MEAFQLGPQKTHIKRSLKHMLNTRIVKHSTAVAHNATHLPSLPRGIHVPRPRPREIILTASAGTAINDMRNIPVSFRCVEPVLEVAFYSRSSSYSSDYRSWSTEAWNITCWSTVPGETESLETQRDCCSHKRAKDFRKNCVFLTTSILFD